MAQIASENSIHPNQIHKWKKQALEDFVQIFEEDRTGARASHALSPCDRLAINLNKSYHLILTHFQL